MNVTKIRMLEGESGVQFSKLSAVTRQRKMILVLLIFKSANGSGCFSSNFTWDADSSGFSNVTSAVGFCCCWQLDIWIYAKGCVLTQENCQSICAESSGCKGFTFFDGDAIPHGNYCENFEDTRTPSSCSNCVSGPSSCFCSGKRWWLCWIELNILL